MDNHNISQEILSKIKDVKPKPRWQFLLRDYSIWFLAALSLIFSSLSFSVVLYMLIDNDWDVYTRISDSLLEFVFLTLPYFWIIFLAFFIVVAYYNFRHTKKGYKIEFGKIFLASLAVNILIGAFFYNAGVGRAIDNVVASKMPFYGHLVNKREKIWSSVEKGFLGGVVMSVDPEYINLMDIEGNVWKLKHFNTTTPHFANLRPGQPIRIVGQKIDSNNFDIHMIMPMKGLDWMKDRYHMMCERKNCPPRINR